MWPVDWTPPPRPPLEQRYVTEEIHVCSHAPEAPRPLTNAERPARYPARRVGQQPPVPVKREPAAARRSRLQRWDDEFAVLVTV